MEWLKLAWQALKYGQKLDDAALWKNRQDLGNVFLGLVTVGAAVLAHWRIVLAPDDIAGVASGLTAVGILWNKYFIHATTESLGFGKAAALAAGPPLPPVAAADALPHSDPDPGRSGPPDLARGAGAGPAPEPVPGTVWHDGAEF